MLCCYQLAELGIQFKYHFAVVCAKSVAVNFGSFFLLVQLSCGASCFFPPIPPFCPWYSVPVQVWPLMTVVSRRKLFILWSRTRLAYPNVSTMKTLSIKICIFLLKYHLSLKNVGVAYSHKIELSIRVSILLCGTHLICMGVLHTYTGPRQ